MHRFAPLLVALFPELRPAHGIIESPLIRMQHRPWSASKTVVKGSFWIKCDHALPVDGSIKARGGIFEVLRNNGDVYDFMLFKQLAQTNFPFQFFDLS